MCPHTTCFTSEQSAYIYSTRQRGACSYSSEHMEMNYDTYVIKQVFYCFTKYWNTSLHRNQVDARIADFKLSYWSENGKITLYNDNAEENDTYILEKPSLWKSTWNILYNTEVIGTMRKTSKWSSSFEISLGGKRLDISPIPGCNYFALQSPIAEFKPRWFGCVTVVDIVRSCTSDNNIENANSQADRDFAINYALLCVVFRRKSFPLNFALCLRTFISKLLFPNTYYTNFLPGIIYLHVFTRKVSVVILSFLILRRTGVLTASVTQP